MHLLAEEIRKSDARGRQVDAGWLRSCSWRRRCMPPRHAPPPRRFPPSGLRMPVVVSQWIDRHVRDARRALQASGRCGGRNLRFSRHLQRLHVDAVNARHLRDAPPVGAVHQHQQAPLAAGWPTRSPIRWQTFRCPASGRIRNRRRRPRRRGPAVAPGWRAPFAENRGRASPHRAAWRPLPCALVVSGPGVNRSLLGVMCQVLQFVAVAVKGVGQMHGSRHGIGSRLPHALAAHVRRIHDDVFDGIRVYACRGSLRSTAKSASLPGVIEPLLLSSKVA